MKRRAAGGLEVSAIGLGCMSMTPIYGDPSEPEAIATIHRAVEFGIDLIDTSDAYANGRNEELVGRAIKGRRDKIVLATKFGQIRRPDGTGEVSGRPDYVRAACEASLKRLAVDCIDLYYIHRIDATVPIEDTVGAMARARARRARSAISASPRRRPRPSGARTRRIRSRRSRPSTRCGRATPEESLLDTCAELGIWYVAYAPLGRGFLTGTITARRRSAPRTGGASIRASSRRT